MRQIVFFDTFGEIKQIVVSNTSTPERYGSGPHIVVEQEDQINAAVTWVRDGLLVPRQPRPEQWSVFNHVTEAWEDLREVDEVYDEAIVLVRSFHNAVNKQRLAVITAGVGIAVAGYGPVALQARPEDQTSLQGLAFTAQLRLGTGDSTTLMDFLDRENTLHQLTPMQMIDLWQQGAAFVSAVYARSWVIKGMDPITTDVSDATLWVIE